jgi:hypothetical protein
MVSFEIAQAITEQKAKYGRFIDTKQWSKFNEIALPDAELHFWDTNGQILLVGRTPVSFRSTQAFTDFFHRFFADAETLHMFGPGELKQISKDEVKAIWGMEDQIFLKSTANIVGVRGGGYYHEIWKLKDGEWFLKSLNLRRTYTHVTPMARVLQILQSCLGLTLY